MDPHPFLHRWRQDLRARVASFEANDRIAADAAPPLPPPELIRRVNSADKADPHVFLRSGASDLLAIVATLVDAVESRTQRDEVLVSERPTVMELGCGVGRLLRHAPPLKLARVVATDVNAESLDWCQANLPDVEYHHHTSMPPIASVPAASVDVIYAHSVFTHIPLERQIAWLRELERVLRPGGWFAVTFLGRTQQDALLDATQRATLAAEGSIQIHPEWTADGTDGPTAYGATCQTIPHQDATVGTVFELCLRRERPGRQDVLVVRRHAGS